MSGQDFNQRSFEELEAIRSPYLQSPAEEDVYMPIMQYSHKKPLNVELIPDPGSSYKRYLGCGVVLVSLVSEHVLSHPFVVLRRQCQVHHTSERYHLLPVVLIGSVYRLHQGQSWTTLWKGLGSVLVVKGMSVGVEDLISKVTPWPKAVRWGSSVKQFFQHILLKCLSFAIVTPFYSASFVETVQSEIASETPAMMDVFREGFIRLLNWNGSAKGRMLPIYAIVVPTVTLCLAKYLTAMVVRSLTRRILEIRCRHHLETTTGALPKDLSSSSAMQEVQVTSTIFANMVSDVVFFPCETIVHRLHLQGTRTIVDNLDNGRSVLPILTNYAGAIDCYEHCMATEGFFGLYKGFGALILQYTLHLSLLHVAQVILTEIVSMLQKQPRPVPPAPPLPSPLQNQPPTMRPHSRTTDISPPAISNLTLNRRSYLLP